MDTFIELSRMSGHIMCFPGGRPNISSCSKHVQDMFLGLLLSVKTIILNKVNYAICNNANRMKTEADIMQEMSFFKMSCFIEAHIYKSHTVTILWKNIEKCH